MLFDLDATSLQVQEPHIARSHFQSKNRPSQAHPSSMPHPCGAGSIEKPTTSACGHSQAAAGDLHLVLPPLLGIEQCGAFDSETKVVFLASPQRESSKALWWWKARPPSTTGQASATSQGLYHPRTTSWCNHPPVKQTGSKTFGIQIWAAAANHSTKDVNPLGAQVNLLPPTTK